MNRPAFVCTAAFPEDRNGPSANVPRDPEMYKATFAWITQQYPEVKTFYGASKGFCSLQFHFRSNEGAS